MSHLKIMQRIVTYATGIRLQSVFV